DEAAMNAAGKRNSQVGSGLGKVDNRVRRKASLAEHDPGPCHYRSDARKRVLGDIIYQDVCKAIAVEVADAGDLAVVALYDGKVGRVDAELDVCWESSRRLGLRFRVLATEASRNSRQAQQYRHHPVEK